MGKIKIFFLFFPKKKFWPLLGGAGFIFLFKIRFNLIFYPKLFSAIYGMIPFGFSTKFFFDSKGLWGFFFLL